MNESLSTSQTKFVKLFPTLLELSQNYKAETFVPHIEDIAALRTPTALCVKISPMYPNQLEIEILPPERKVKKSPSISTDRGSTPKKRKAVSLSRLSGDHRHNKENVFFKFNDL